MTTSMIGFVGIFGYGLLSLALFALCAWIVNQTYPEQRQTAQVTQTTNQQLTIIHNETAIRATRKTNRVA